MKALTICQPYAHLIVTPQDELPDGHTQKRVENRTWFYRSRGLLAIHAGKSRSFMGPEDDEIFPDLIFGAVVGVCWVKACFAYRQIRRGLIPREYEWLGSHEHTEGPYCIVLEKPLRLVEPIPVSGKQGVWDWDVDPTRLKYEVPANG